MNIDLFQIIAQMVNFFILLFLLNKLFYKPVIKAMDVREENITVAQEKAEKRMEEANDLAAAASQQLADIEITRQELFSKAKLEATEQKQRFIEKHREDAEQQRQYFAQEVEEERERFLQNVRKVLGESAVRIASKILTMVTTQDLFDRTFSLFLDAVRSVEQTALRDAQGEKDRVVLYSAHEMSQDQKEALEAVLRDHLNLSRPISYEIDTDLVLGFELRFETLTVHKSARRYLEETEASIRESLEKDRR